MSDAHEQRVVAAAIRALERKKLVSAFDAFRPDTRANKRQEEILRDIGQIKYRYVVAGNQSGKSQLAAREIAWMLTDTHPYWTRPEEWGEEPMLILIAGQDLTMMATELWAKKLAPFLDRSEWRPEKQGNTLKKVVNRRTGDQIVFLSHSDGSEKNRKHMQGYTAHYVWLDEMPTNTAILEELQLRVQSKKGYLLATFTPKFRNDKIRRIVDGCEAPYSRKYKMSKFDNPIFADAFEEEMSRLAGFSEAERRTILYGDWSTGDNAVYHFDYEKMTVDSLPAHYHAGWRHTESVDPALRSKCGYTLWAEDPNTGIWYLVNDQYVQGDASLDPEQLFHIIQKRSNNHNIVRRISDSMAYYTSVAAKYGVGYMIPHSKNNRKDELIKGLQVGLSSGKVKIGRWCGTFIDEIQSCQFQEDTDKIINSSSYHTLDCAQYFCDNVPIYEPDKAALPWQTMLHQAHQRNLQQISEQQNLNQKNMNGRGGRVQRTIGGWASSGGRKKFRVS
jgi:phage terminase large subunit-like protein